MSGVSRFLSRREKKHDHHKHSATAITVCLHSPHYSSILWQGNGTSVANILGISATLAAQPHNQSIHRHRSISLRIVGRRARSSVARAKAMQASSASCLTEMMRTASCDGRRARPIASLAQVPLVYWQRTWKADNYPIDRKQTSLFRQHLHTRRSKAEVRQGRGQEDQRHTRTITAAWRRQYRRVQRPVCASYNSSHTAR